MLATAETFAAMTRQMPALAAEVCGGQIAFIHEGGYAEVYMPFCGHATIAALAGSYIEAQDPFAETFRRRQPTAGFDSYVGGLIGEMAEARRLRG